jgi:hypothetical protein
MNKKCNAAALKKTVPVIYKIDQKLRSNYHELAQLRYNVSKIEANNIPEIRSSLNNYILVRNLHMGCPTHNPKRF